MADNELLEIKTDIAVIKRDIHQLDTVIKKFDKFLDQLSDVLLKLAVFDKVTEASDKRLADLERKFEVHAKMMESVEKMLGTQLQSLQENIEEARYQKHKELLDQLSAMRAEFNIKATKQEERISGLENWRYYALGMAAVIVFILAKMELPSFF